MVKKSLIFVTTNKFQLSVKSGTSLSVRSSVEAHGARRLGAGIRGLVVETVAVFDDAVPLKQNC